MARARPSRGADGGGGAAPNVGRARVAFTLRRPGRIRDARGRLFSFLDPFDPRLIGQNEVIPALELREIRRDLGFGYPVWQRRAYLASVVIFFCCIAFLVFWKFLRRTGVDAFERVLWPLNLAIFAFAAIMFWRGARMARSKHVQQVMLKRRRCPHCGYDLRDLPVDSRDEATVCPECGAAWRLGD